MKARADFQTRFGCGAELAADAPGRVNLIGEHTDYNDGYVLPAAIPQRTRVELARRRDDRVRVASVGRHDGAVCEFRLGAEERTGHWIDYVQGCVRELAAAGHRIDGFDALISSDVPIGAGLSSSAALEVALLRALRAAFELDLDDVALAMVGHRCENAFVGAHVGVMDQMAASLCDGATALFVDTRSLTWERISLPAGGELAIIDSGVPHEHAHGEYNVRRHQCEQAARLLGVRALRDLSVDDLSRAAELPEPLSRRVRHVVRENARVLAAVGALRIGDLARLGDLFYASHASLRDDYEVSTHELDTLVALARDHEDVYGARMTGGGFGGSVVLACKRGAAGEIATRTARAYERTTGRTATVLVPATAAA